jgi:hypothetical protein
MPKKLYEISPWAEFSRRVSMLEVYLLCYKEKLSNLDLKTWPSCTFKVPSVSVRAIYPFPTDHITTPFSSCLLVIIAAEYF